MARLSAKQRKRLPASDFAGPDRSFPINNPSHARNALARASQFHPELKAKIRAKVRRKFPSIQMKMDGGAVRPRLDRRARGGKVHREEGGEATSPERAAHNRGIASKMIKGAISDAYTGGLGGLAASGLNPTAGAAGMGAGALIGAGRAYKDSPGFKFHNKDVDGEKRGGRIKK
jgi:hypothetical protein